MPNTENKINILKNQNITDSNEKALQAKHRLNYVDGIKGIGIWLIVLGHMLSPGNLFKSYTYGFHVPNFLFRLRNDL